MSIICPICKKDDALRKVSAVVAAGTSSGEFVRPSVGVANSGEDWLIAGGFEKISGSISSNLARLLSPPSQPSGLSCLIWGLVIFPGSILFVITPGFFLGAGVLDGIMSGEMAAIIATIFVILPLGIAYFRFFKRRHDRKLLQEKFRYEIESQFFNRQYYCFRDDIVFDPDVGSHVPSSEFQLLMSDYYHKSLATNDSI